jgi:coenzyme F420-0:L-glutamate ligase/coenzyme F420-1:gamma-L-glutamate ligase
MGDSLEILPIRGIGRITPGTDLAAAIADAAPWLRDGDVLVVTSKIVSKAEGQLVDIPADGPERDAAREEILVEQTARPVARRGATRIVATHHGFVMAAAGIDASNVERSQLALLPKDPDASARALRAALAQRYGLDVAVIVSDTMGRPWRNGLTDVALGAAGIEPIRDHRGEVDPYGNELQITQMAVVDELSAAAELVKGKCDQVPVAVVRGYLTRPTLEDGPGGAALIRDAASDMFSLGTAEAHAAGLSDAAALPPAGTFGDGLVDAASLNRVVRGIPLAATTRIQVETGFLVCTTLGESPPDLIALGVDLHRVRCALAAAGFASTVDTSAAGAKITVGNAAI